LVTASDCAEAVGLDRTRKMSYILSKDGKAYRWNGGRNADPCVQVVMVEVLQDVVEPFIRLFKTNKFSSRVSRGTSDARSS
jgi:hypothetical protein